MILENNHLMADEGKILRRISDGTLYGKEIWLGYSYYIGGKLQRPPHLDIPEDFEEIDEDDETIDAEITAEEALRIILGKL